MITRTQQSVKVPVGTVARIEKLMILTQAIIKKVYSAPEEDRAGTLATASLDLSRGIKGIWRSGGQFREDLAIIQGIGKEGQEEEG